MPIRPSGRSTSARTPYPARAGVSSDPRQPILPGPPNMPFAHPPVPSPYTPPWAQAVVQQTGNLPPSRPLSDDELIAARDALRQKSPSGGGNISSKFSNSVISAGNKLSVINYSPEGNLDVRMNGADFKSGNEMEIRGFAPGGKITNELKNASFLTANKMTATQEARNVHIRHEGVSSECARGDNNWFVGADQRATLRTNKTERRAGNNLGMGFRANELDVNMTEALHRGENDQSIFTHGKGKIEISRAKEPGQERL